MSSIYFQVAAHNDIDHILALQEKYHVSNFNEREKSNGFVTTRFTVGQIKDIISQEGLFIAKTSHKVVAYVFAGSWTYFSQWEIFNVMTARFPPLSFNGLKITTANSFQYGPICIDEEYRGHGLIYELFEFMRIHLIKRYPLGVTFINKVNVRSFKVHVDKLHWKVIDEFDFNNNGYYILAYNMNKSALESLIR